MNFSVLGRSPAFPTSAPSWAIKFLAVAGLGMLMAVAQAADTDGDRAAGDEASTGVVRLQQPRRDELDGVDAEGRRQPSTVTESKKARGPLSDFERYINQIVTRANDPLPYTDIEGKPVRAPEIRRFGSELMTPAGRTGMTAENSARIPDDYQISIGDEVLVTLWGSVSADLRLVVDRGGRITIPRVGPVLVAGLRYADLGNAVEQRVAQVFRNFKVSASLGKLRSIRVYVTGFTAKPGAYTVSSLSTLVNALMTAGGPSGAGSFRNIELRRGGKALTHFDFYELLLKGDKTADRSLQAEDVIFVGPVGPEVALIGSVNKAAIFELKPKETVADVLDMAGGFTALADRSRLTVEHLDARDTERINELRLPTDSAQLPRAGDLLRAYSAVAAALPQYKQNKLVRVEGEVQHPGEFVLPANSSLLDAVAAAGGLTKEAFLFGADFSRESVRATQQQNYDRALRDLETEFTRASATQRASNAEDAAAQAAKAQNSARLIERMRAVSPTGRIVLQMDPMAPRLPAMSVEDGDRLLIPARPTTIGVFGSVFNGGSYLFADGSTLSDFLKLAGGPTRGADEGSAFVLRANGSVVSSRQKSSGWFSMNGNIDNLRAEPGDTIFVPESMDKTTFIQSAKDWTQILYQFGLGAAALQTIRSN